MLNPAVKYGVSRHDKKRKTTANEDTQKVGVTDDDAGDMIGLREMKAERGSLIFNASRGCLQKNKQTKKLKSKNIG